jgi:hypothetical protein
VLKRSVDTAFAGFLLIVSLPLLALSAFLVKLNSVRPAIFRWFWPGRSSRHIDRSNLQAAPEFGFEHAIEAYEELIDATLTEGQV